MATKVQVRRDTAANWVSVDPVLGTGEIGFESDSGRLKVGDNATEWSGLPYLGGWRSEKLEHQWG